MKQVLVFSLLIVNTALAGQKNHKNYLQGFDKEISGLSFGYHSALPDVNASLLMRGRSDYEAISWMTEVVPEDYNEKEVAFIWLFNMDVSKNPANFILSLNGEPYLSFKNVKEPEIGVRKIEGKNGSVLTLNTTMLDISSDQMGFASLKIPTRHLPAGKPALIEISSDTDGNNAWYMTFKSKIKQSTDLYQNNVIVKEKGKLYNSVSIDFIHIGDEVRSTVSIKNAKESIQLTPGYNKLELLLPKVEEETQVVAKINTEGKKELEIPVTIKPVKEWEIYLVQHTHTDIGYTRPQSEILPEHLRYIDHALDFCDQTDDYPDAAKFRWTCETSWSVREYLRSRPQEQIDRLLKRVKEGRIEVTGMFLNYSEIIDEPALAAQTKTLRMIQNKGFDVKSLMQNDVNGIAWCLVDYYNTTDVKYLNMGIHAHRARKPFDKPTTFWWQSPSGNRLLAYRSEHYMHGNVLGLNSGKMDVLRNNLSKYLNSLEEKNYPYDKVAFQFSGYITDNSPPSTQACDIIKEWNEKYEWPKLRSSLARDFLIYIDEKHSDEIPVKEVAWPDWWTDGVGSAANETKEVRSAHVNISSTSSLLAMAKMAGKEIPAEIHNEIEKVYDNLLFYDEHTHGASESIRDPLAQNTINQWGMKSSYAWEAAKLTTVVEEKAMAIFEPVLPKTDKPSLAVFNTLNWNRSGMHTVFLSNEVTKGGDFVIIDSEGKEVPFQKYQQRTEGAYYGLWVSDIPAMGYKTFGIIPGQNKKPEINSIGKSLENAYYNVDIDERKGVISSIYDKELQIELVDPLDSLSLGNFIYEQLKNRHEMERLTMSRRDTVYKPLNLKRSVMKDVKLVRTQSGAIYNSLFLNGKMPVCTDSRGVDIEIRLYHYTKKIELHYSMHKLEVTDPEAVYISFPFQLEGGKLAFEAQGGVVYPGKNQLEGSSSDWNTIQNFASVRNDESQIVFVSSEIPLVQFGDLNIGRYYYRLNPKTNHIYSWVLNNYWVTNFKASQKGQLQWTYSITSSDDNSDVFATRYGWGERVGFKSRVMLPSIKATDSRLISKSFINLEPENLLLVNTSVSRDNSGIILHLREVEGDHAVIDIRKLKEETGATSIHEVSILEEEMDELSSPLLMEHYETKFILLRTED
ncbi:MAG: hypothetical protein MI975_09695 [Cytophagales bacterium]|nr:hypothetical protein [Cytophagales bacterium]